MNSLESFTLDQILETYDLPHRLLAYFASQCAKDALSRLDNPDPRSVLAVSVAERFGNGEDFSQEYLEKICNAASAAYAAAYAASYAASTAAYAAAYAAASATTYASYAAYSAYPSYSDSYKPLLLDLIEKRLTPLEKLLILG